MAAKCFFKSSRCERLVLALNYFKPFKALSPPFVSIQSHKTRLFSFPLQTSLIMAIGLVACGEWRIAFRRPSQGTCANQKRMSHSCGSWLKSAFTLIGEWKLSQNARMHQKAWLLGLCKATLILHPWSGSDLTQTDLSPETKWEHCTPLN